MNESLNLREFLWKVEKAYILHFLLKNRWNRKKVALLLGLSLNSLKKRMKHYRLKKSDYFPRGVGGKMSKSSSTPSPSPI